MKHIDFNEEKVNLCKKLADIDYSLFVIEKEDRNSTISLYSQFTYSELRVMLCGRLLDFAQAELYRDYSQPLTQKAS